MQGTIRITSHRRLALSPGDSDAICGELNGLPDGRSSSRPYRLEIRAKFGNGRRWLSYSVLSEFRDQLIKGSQEQVLLEAMLTGFKAKKPLKSGGKQRNDSSHILAAIRVLNRLVLV